MGHIGGEDLVTEQGDLVIVIDLYAGAYVFDLAGGITGGAAGFLNRHS